MGYEEIEDLVVSAKSGDLKAKEILMVKFAPFIKKLSKTSIIHGYEREDIQDECYKTLFKCIFYYNSDDRSFITYATKTIKHNIDNLSKLMQKRLISEKNKALIMEDQFINHFSEDDVHFEDKIYNSSIKDFVNEIAGCDKELTNFVFYDKKRINEHSTIKTISSNTVLDRKYTALKNAIKIVDNHKSGGYLN